MWQTFRNINISLKLEIPFYSNWMILRKSKFRKLALINLFFFTTTTATPTHPPSLSLHLQPYSFFLFFFLYGVRGLKLIILFENKIPTDISRSFSLRFFSSLLLRIFFSFPFIRPFSFLSSNNEYPLCTNKIEDNEWNLLMVWRIFTTSLSNRVLVSS